jgi:hypothetical protein
VHLMAVWHGITQGKVPPPPPPIIVVRVCAGEMLIKIYFQFKVVGGKTVVVGMKGFGECYIW